MTQVDVKIRSGDACVPDPYLLWDTGWVQDLDNQPFGGYGDWAIAEGPDKEPQNQVGLKAQKALETAILIQLFTDRRVDDEVQPPDGTDDRRGWAGDGFDLRADLDEQPMGSHLWLLERAPLYSNETRILAEQYCREALQVLIDQGAVADFDVTVETDSIRGAMLINVSAYSETRSTIYQQRFARVWEQVE
jgi:phage gp46-like protein